MKTKILIILCLICFKYGATQNRYVGVWESASKSNLVHEPMLWNAFVNKNKSMQDNGLRLNDFEIIKKGPSVKYVGSWRSGSGRTKLSKALVWKDFLEKGENLTEKGYRLVDFETFNKVGKQYYVGFWKKGFGNNIITKGLKWNAFLKKGEELTQKGFRLTDFETFKKAGSYFYVGNWRSGSGSNLITKGLKWNTFLEKGEELTVKGLRLYDVEIIKIGNTKRYVGAWKNGTGGNIITKGLKWNDFLEKGKKMTQNGYRLLDLEVFKPKSTTGQNSTPNSNTLPDISSFTKTPNYIKLLNGNLGSNKYRVTVDFTNLIDGKPEITIPTKFLKNLPSYEGKIILPDNFCGLKIIKADRFVWYTNTDGVYQEKPYNYITESSSIREKYMANSEGINFYNGGIDFTGPIGKCANSNNNWVFSKPFMENYVSMPQPLKLEIELGSTSEVQFVNYKLSPGKSLGAIKLFKKSKAEKLLKYYEKTLLGSLEKWVKAYCKKAPEECVPWPENDEN